MTDPIPNTSTASAASEVNYTELSAAELAKLINEEYGHVPWNERTNLKRAKDIGEKLIALRAGAKHGEWKIKLKKWCPKLSYETATRYIRIFERWPEIEKAAAAKNVKTTDLTMETALKLLAKPPPVKLPKTTTETDSEGNPRTSASATLGAVAQPATDFARDEDIAKQYLSEVWEPDELVSVLREVRDDEYLRQLAAALTKVLQPPTETQTATETATTQAPAEGSVSRRI